MRFLSVDVLDKLWKSYSELNGFEFSTVWKPYKSRLQLPTVQQLSIMFDNWLQENGMQMYNVFEPEYIKIQVLDEEKATLALLKWT